MFTSIQFYDALNFFIYTFMELAALFVLISFAVGLLQQKLPVSRVQQLLSGNRGYLVAVALGSVTPFCSCSTLPMTTGLIRAKAAFGPTMAFLFTSPLLNPFLFGLLWLFFGGMITVLYSLSVIILAIVSGYLLERFHFQRFIHAELLQGDVSMSAANTSGLLPRFNWQQAFLNAWGQFLTFIPYMMIGVGVGAILHGYIPQAWFLSFANQEPWWLIPAAALLGVFLYVRASTMVPIAASLAAKGLSLGSIMALTIGGAGASLPELIMLKKIFRFPMLIAFVLLVFSTACITGLLINQLVLG